MSEKILKDNVKGWLKREQRVCGRSHDLPSIITKDFYGWTNPKKRGFHREKNLPSHIYYLGAKSWYYKGKYNRKKNLPVIIDENGKKKYSSKSLLERIFFKKNILQNNFCSIQ